MFVKIQLVAIIVIIFEPKLNLKLFYELLIKRPTKEQAVLFYPSAIAGHRIP